LRYYDFFSINSSSGYDLKRTTIKNWDKRIRIPANNLPNIINSFLTMNLKVNVDDKFKIFSTEINKNLAELEEIAKNFNSDCNIGNK